MAKKKRAENIAEPASNDSVNPAQARESDHIAAAWIVSILTMVSRVLGYARLIILVQIFSPIRWASDAFIFAFRIPNLFRNLLGEGALSAAFIPSFVSANEREGRTSASILASQAFTLLSLVGGGIAAAGVVVCLALDRVWDGGPELSLALRLTALLFPFMPLICLAALLSGMLQGLRRFALPAALSIVLNLGFLAGFAYIYWWMCGGDLGNLDPSATYALALFVLAAGFIEVVLQLPALLREGIFVRPALSFNHPGLGAAIKAFVPVAVGLGLVQLNAFIDSLIAGSLSLAHPGAVTYLEIGFRFMQLPLGVFGVSIATASFPEFASSASAKDHAAFAAHLSKSIRMAMFLLLPSSAVLIPMADPIVRLTCQRPDLDFSHAAVYRSSLVLAIYAGGLIFYSARQILVRAFYAYGDYSYPVKVAMAMVGLNLVLNLVLINAPDPYRLLNPDYPAAWGLSDKAFPGGLKMGEAGLALATFLTAIVDSTLLVLGFRKRVAKKADREAWGAELPRIGATALRMVIASAGLGILTWFFRDSIPYEPEFWRLVERVFFPCVLAAVAFYFISVILPLPEVGEFGYAMFRRRKRGK